MPNIPLEEVQAKLPELIDKLLPGEDVIITRGDRPVAKLVSQRDATPQPVFGRGQGKVVVISEDDEHLKGFEDYMP